MYYKSDEHKIAFFTLLNKSRQHKDCEYCSALYAMSALGKDVDKYVQEGGGIKFPLLFEDAAPWSSSEQALLKLAGVLFGAGVSLDVEELFWHLDEENCQVVLQALEIRYLR